MSISKRNSEGYFDPTAYEALTAVEKEEKATRVYRPMVFICSPLAGDVSQNIENARHYCRFAVEQGAIPIAPHLIYPQFMDDGDKTQRELGIFFGLVLMGKCDEMWVFGERVSAGMAAEIKAAKRKNIRICYFNEFCKEVTG